MGSDSIGPILLIVALVILSGFFSATETAFSSLNRIRLKNQAGDGDKRAQLALRLSEDFDRLLSTILIGNNIVNIASTAVATILFVRLWPDTGATISTVVMTVIVLIFGEVSPKSLAKERPEQFAMAVAPAVFALEKLFFPLTWFFAQWKKLLSRVFHSGEDRSITEEELLTIVEEAENDGGIGEEESELIRSAIEFNELECSDILTPRVEMVAVEQGQSPDEIMGVFTESAFSRLPVYEEDLDSIVGVINRKDFYDKVMLQHRPVTDAVTDVTCVPPNTKISRLLRMFQSSKSHMAVVIDEYGGTMGIVTMEDILEELVGEIWDEHDEVVEEFVDLGDHQYRILCSADLDEMFELFDKEREYDAATVSGWVMAELGKIPEEGDTFTYENLHVTVSKTDHRKVLEILVRMDPENPEAIEEE